VSQPIPLADLVVDPSRINDLTPDEAREILVQMIPLQSSLLARALAVRVAEITPPADSLLLVQDAAAKLGIAPSHLYELIRQGRVPAVKLGPKYVRLNPTVVAEIQQKGLATALGSTYSPRRDRRRTSPYPKKPGNYAGGAG